MRHGACSNLTPMRPLHLATLLGAAVLALAAPDARAEDPRAEMARALEEQADVVPTPALLPARAPIIDAPARTAAPPSSTGLARAAETVAAQASGHARGLAIALARAARAAWTDGDPAADQAARARRNGHERPGRRPRR
jgi:hypothetical protein